MLVALGPILEFAQYTYTVNNMKLLRYYAVSGVFCRYGFVTFETQEDAEKIIKKDSENLIFKDRKLNIGPAVRKQVI